MAARKKKAVRKRTRRPKTRPDKQCPKCGVKMREVEGAGRPTKRSAEVERLVLLALQRGNSYTVAAEYAAIDPDTLLRWRRDDPDFAVACKRAKAKSVVFATDKLFELVKRENLGAICYFLKTHGGDEWKERAREEDQAETAAALVRLLSLMDRSNKGEPAA